MVRKVRASNAIFVKLGCSLVLYEDFISAAEVERARDRELSETFDPEMTPFDDVVVSSSKSEEFDNLEESCTFFNLSNDKPTSYPSILCESDDALAICEVKDYGGSPLRTTTPLPHWGNTVRFDEPQEDATVSVDPDVRTSVIGQEQNEFGVRSSLTLPSASEGGSKLVTPTNQIVEKTTPGAPVAVDPRNLSPDDFRVGRDRPRSRSMPVTLESGMHHLSPVSLFRKAEWAKFEGLPDDFLRLNLASPEGSRDRDATDARIAVQVAPVSGKNLKGDNSSYVS